MPVTYESPASNKAKNEKYLERLAGIINRYAEANNRTPEIFDDALDTSGQMLPNRGDADGNPYSYLRIGNHAFVLKPSAQTRRTTPEQRMTSSSITSTEIPSPSKSYRAG